MREALRFILVGGGTVILGLSAAVLILGAVDKFVWRVLRRGRWFDEARRLDEAAMLLPRAPGVEEEIAELEALYHAPSARIGGGPRRG